MNEIDLQIFALTAAGYSMTKIAERLGYSQHGVVSKRVRKLQPLYDWLSTFLPASDRKLAEQKALTRSEQQLERYLGLWDRVLDKAEEHLEAGDVSVAKDMLKDLRERQWGVPAKRLLVGGKIAVEGEVTHTHSVDVSVIGQIQSVINQQKQLYGVRDIVDGEELD